MAKAEDIMSQDVYIVGPNDPLAAVRNLFMKKKISRVLVYDDRPLGMVTEKDMAKIFFEERRGIDEVRVKEIMSDGVLTASANSKPEEIAKIMHENDVHGIPVLADGKITGIVTKSDIVDYFIKSYNGRAKISDIMDKEIHTVREYHSIFKAAKLMKEKGVDKVIVLRHKKPIAVLTARDISMASFGLRPSHVVFLRKRVHGPLHRHINTYPLIVADLMKEGIYSISPDKDAAVGARIMGQKGVASLLVQKNDKMIGLVTKNDYVSYLASLV
jgi:CBS domain-containing protein